MKKSEESVEDLGFDVDDVAVNDMPLHEVTTPTITVTESYQRVKATPVVSEGTTSCLRNERIIVRHIPKETGIVSNPKHVLYGGMAESAVRTFVVPKLASGMYVNVLTDKEKTFLEEIMGLEYNALSIYKKVDNFWDDANEIGIARVRLIKQDNYFDLANPEDFIKYKILLANKDFIAPSIKVLQDMPKVTYQFVIIAEGEETKSAKDNMSFTMRAYKEFGKVEDNIDILRTIVETIDGRPTAPTVKLEFLQTKINNLIQADSKMFCSVITDPALETKVLIKRAIEAGIISNRGNYLYYKVDNTPLCETNEEPTLNIAAKYLNSPKRQDLKFLIQGKLK